MTKHASAAICIGPNEPFVIKTVELDRLRPDELLIRMAGSGICHTDLAARDRQIPMPIPAVLGHEGSGTVEMVGDAVTDLKVGDRVVMSFNSCDIAQIVTTTLPRTVMISLRRTGWVRALTAAPR